MWKLGDLIPIERPDGSCVDDFQSRATWQDTLSVGDGPGEHANPISFDEFVREGHHHYYGRPWILGQLYFEELVRRGLRPSDRVLDVGCGAGRLAIKLIPFLDTARYRGVDSHLRSLVAFASYEARLHDLASKAPRLMLSAGFDFASFAETFDVVLDFFVTEHLPEAAAETAYARMRAVASDGARVFTLKAPKFGIERMRSLGFELRDCRSVSYALPAPTTVIHQLTDEWHEFFAV